MYFFCRFVEVIVGADTSQQLFGSYLTNLTLAGMSAFYLVILLGF